jgi:hypothetical protein
MNVTTSAILAAYPEPAARFFSHYTPLWRSFAYQNIATTNEILSLIWILNEEGRLSIGHVAKELGVRKLNGIWCQIDPIGHATSLAELESQGFDVTDDRRPDTEEPQFELPVGVITSTRELSDKLHITMRRAQQIYAAKVADLAAGRDLFGMGV